MRNPNDTRNKHKLAVADYFCAFLAQAEYGSDTFSDVRNLNDTQTSIDLNAGFTGTLAGQS